MKTNILADAEEKTNRFSPMRLNEKRRGHIKALGLEINRQGNLWHPKTRQVMEFFLTKTGQDILAIVGYQSNSKDGMGYETIEKESSGGETRGLSVRSVLPVIHPTDQQRLAQWKLIDQIDPVDE